MRGLKKDVKAHQKEVFASAEQVNKRIIDHPRSKKKVIHSPTKTSDCYYLFNNLLCLMKSLDKNVVSSIILFFSVIIGNSVLRNVVSQLPDYNKKLLL